MARAFIHGQIHTMETPTHTATAMLWDERVLAIGDDATIRRLADEQGITVEDLGGRVVIPGFVDAHMHLLHVGIQQTRPDLRGASSKADALARCAAWLAANDAQGPVIGEGWDEADWHGDAPPTRQELDALSDRPLVLRRICGHKAVANTPALAMIHPHWPDERVDQDTGVLLEEPSLYLNEVIPADDATLDVAVQEACRTAARLGATTVCTYEQLPLRDAWIRAAADLPIRVHCNVYAQALEEAIAQGFRTGRPVGGDRLRDGGLKVFLDGSLGGHTALMQEPYDDRPDTVGRAIWSDEELDHLFATAQAAGIQIHAHVIGDGAVEQGLRAYERLAEQGPLEIHPSADAMVDTLKHRFEHYEIVHDDQVQRTAAMGIWASSQPNFVGVWSAKGGMYHERIGERFALNNRFQTFQGAGIRVAFGSDGMPFGPLVGIQAAVEHPVEAERMDAAEAVWHYTHEAAASLGRTDIGVLQVGAQADLLVLDIHDLQDKPAKQWIVQETIVGGQTVATNDAPYPCDDA